VDKAAEFAREMIGPVKRFAADLGLSIDERNREQFRHFLAAMPEWRTSLEPKALKTMDADGRRHLGAVLVSALGAFARDEGPARATLQKQDALYHLAFRMKVREAALARARTLLDTVAGLLYLGDHPAERAALERLLDCESLDLKLPKPTSGQPNARQPALPPLDDDRAGLRALLGDISQHRLDLPPTLRAGEPAPELQVIPYRGEIPRIGDGKPVLLFFWSKTCGKCRSVVQELARAREGGESILAITDDDEPSLDRFFAKYPDLPASIARDPGRQTMFRYGVRGPGALVRLDGQGKVVKVIGRSSAELPAATAE
jgi:thiol-disulfide isomerase/thioredoxin